VIRKIAVLGSGRVEFLLFEFMGCSGNWNT
jgi:hypothetical protein